MTTATMTATVPTVTKSDWQTGFDLYLEGKSESSCQNMAQIKGWWAALDAEATCAVCDRMAANGKSAAEMDDVLDGLTYEEWRYGA